MTEACRKCWQETQDKILNELVVIGLDSEEIKRKVKALEVFISKKWKEIESESGNHRKSCGSD